MSEQFETRLMECLDALDDRSLGAGIDDILMRYPEDAEALRATLGITDALAVFDMQPEPSAQAASRRKFLAAAVSLKLGTARQPNSGTFYLLRTGAFLVAALAAGAIPVAASGSALPGDPLYGIKREVENVQLQMASDPASREALAASINARRVQEVDDLVRDGRSAQTTFEGRLEVLSPDSLTVSGRAIGIPTGVHVPDLLIGTQVEVTVRVENGGLALVAITPLSDDDPLAPTLTPQPALEPSHTPAPEATDKGDSGEAHTAEPTEDGDDGESSGGDDGGTGVEPTHSEDDDNESTPEPTDEGGGDDGDNSGSGGGDDGGDDGDNSGSGGGDDGGGDDGDNSGSGGGGGDD